MQASKIKKIALYILAGIGLISLFLPFLTRTGSTMYGSAGSPQGAEISSIPGGSNPGAQYTKLGSNDQSAAMTSSANPSSLDNGRSQLMKKRMIIRNANLTLQTNDINKSMQQITELANASGGYVVSSRFIQSNQNSDNSYAEISIRVPAEGLENMLTRLKSFSIKVLGEETSGEDITEKYVDIASKLQNLQKSKDQLAKIMESAKKIEDILNIQKQLTETQGQIDGMEGALKYFNETVAFSLITIQLQMNPVIAINKQERWQILDVVKQSYKALTLQFKYITYGIIEFFIFFVPLIILWGIIILFIFWLGRKLYYLIDRRHPE